MLQPLTPEVSVTATATATNLWAGVGYCPYAWLKVNPPGRVHRLTQAIATSSATATAGTLCIPMVSVISHPLPGLSYPGESWTGHCFGPLLSGREQMLENGLQAKIGAKTQSWASGAGSPKRRGRNSLVQSQEQCIKSLQLSWGCVLRGQLWTSEASTGWSKARSESEVTPQSPQVERLSYKYWRTSCLSRLAEAHCLARTGTTEITGKYSSNL